MRTRGTFALGAFVSALVVTSPGAAFAQTAAQCTSSAEEGQQLRASGHLLTAREKFLTCSAQSCPAVVKSDCARWASEVLEAVPTIVVDARDASGKDLTKVKVFSDDAMIANGLDGRGIPIDPGPHKLRFEIEGQAPVTEEILAKENVKGRRVAITFGGSGASGAPMTTPSVDEKPREHSVWPWIVVGAGAATVAVGVVFFVTTPALPPECDADSRTCNRLKDAAGSSVETEEQYQQRQSDAGRHVTQPVMGAMIMAVGGALIIGGLIWHFLEPTGPKSAAKIRFGPTGLAGTF
jgi:hypothetical protein